MEGNARVWCYLVLRRPESQLVDRGAGVIGGRVNPEANASGSSHDRPTVLANTITLMQKFYFKESDLIRYLSQKYAKNLYLCLLFSCR